MTTTKGALFSKGVVGGLVALGTFTPELLAELQSGDITNAATHIVTAIGIIAALYGRITAKAKIHGIF